MPVSVRKLLFVDVRAEAFQRTIQIASACPTPILLNLDRLVILHCINVAEVAWSSGSLRSLNSALRCLTCISSICSLNDLVEIRKNAHRF